VKGKKITQRRRALRNAERKNETEGKRVGSREQERRAGHDFADIGIDRREGKACERLAVF
jgi:hypothetical protein